MEATSLRSPKNKFSAELTYSKPLNGVGSTTTLSANDVAELKARAKFYIDQAHRNDATCHVKISKNIKQYPDFDWKVIDQYEE